MFLTQVGSTITGNYEYQNGRVSGTVSGLVLTANWSEEPTYSPPDDAGTFAVTMSADGSDWSGNWQYSPASSHTGGWFEAYRVQ